MLSQCATSSNNISSRHQIQEFSQTRPYNKDNWFYCGTDLEHHHFITRIGGNTIVFIIPKNEISLARTTKLPPPGVIEVQQIYPDKNFSFGDEVFEWYYNPSK